MGVNSTTAFRRGFQEGANYAKRKRREMKKPGFISGYVEDSHPLESGTVYELGDDVIIIILPMMYAGDTRNTFASGSRMFKGKFSISSPS